MRLVRIRAAGVRLALGLVRARLGPDALVLEVSRVGAEVEVLVAAETELRRSPQASPMPAETREDPGSRALRLRLERAGYLGSVARDLAAAAAGRYDTLTALRGAALRRAPVVDLLGSREPVILFGAGGAGVTTATAMLAARAGLAHRRKVLLIEAGGARRPHPLLAACARLLHARHVLADRPEAIVREASSADGWLVLIDLGELRPLLTGAPEELRRLSSALWGARKVLVADAGAPLLLQAQVRSLGSPLLDAVGLTRTDLSAGSLGPSLSALMEHDARPAFFTSGREIPQSLTPATPDSFARLVLRSLEACGPEPNAIIGGIEAAQESLHV